MFFWLRKRAAVPLEGCTLILKRRGKWRWRAFWGGRRAGSAPDAALCFGECVMRAGGITVLRCW
jgi:hypothetical protein